MINQFNWKIGGPAGFGIMTTGLIFSKTMTRVGLHIFDYIEYPSLIRGGHNSYQVHVSDSPVYSQVKPVNLLVALNRETVDLHKNRLSGESGILFDPDDSPINSHDFPKSVRLYPVPLAKLAEGLGAEKVMINNVALGASLAILGNGIEALFSVIRDIFSGKDPRVAKLNCDVAKAGYDFVKTHFREPFYHSLKKINIEKKIVLTGNEAIGLGAIAAGCKFFALYPMTPINGLLHFIAGHAREYGYIYKQPEDEISGINMAIGASFAGARSLVATSGGGFSLMTEGLGMAAMTETPLIVVMGQRPGPSSGMPTWTDQGDLNFVLNASQGEFLRIVLAPGDVEECFDLTIEAFNIADRFQTPVIILIDKYLAEGHSSISQKAVLGKTVVVDRGKIISAKDNLSTYKRYLLTQDGISPRAFAGQTYFVANSYEHEESGLSTDEVRVKKMMTEKRLKKFKSLTHSLAAPVVYGPKDAPITFIGWGSTKGPVLEAMKQLPEASYIHLNHINPLPTQAVLSLIQKAGRVILVENNATGQMAGWVRQQTGFEIKEKILKYDGRPFYPEEIVTYVKNRRF
jgi:2-oxoglutarate ferredoxin oxidoreductase subunit alpha